MKKYILATLIVILAVLAGYKLHANTTTVATKDDHNKQCWDRAESLNRHAQGIYVEYSGYVVSGWASDQGAINSLNTDVADYNTEVDAYNKACGKQALTAPSAQ